MACSTCLSAMHKRTFAEHILQALQCVLITHRHRHDCAGSPGKRTFSRCVASAWLFVSENSFACALRAPSCQRRTPASAACCRRAAPLTMRASPFVATKTSRSWCDRRARRFCSRASSWRPRLALQLWPAFTVPHTHPPHHSTRCSPATNQSR